MQFAPTYVPLTFAIKSKAHMRAHIPPLAPHLGNIKMGNPVMNVWIYSHNLLKTVIHRTFIRYMEKLLT